jgi:hypothetical protein
LKPLGIVAPRIIGARPVSAALGLSIRRVELAAGNHARLQGTKGLRIHHAPLIVAGLAGEKEILLAEPPALRARYDVIERREICRSMQAAPSPSGLDSTIGATPTLPGEDAIEQLLSLNGFHAAGFSWDARTISSAAQFTETWP